MDKIESIKLSMEISKVFTPSAPIDNATLFAGRTQQMLKVINAITQRGQHVVIFGERGVGKTSLVNILHDVLRDLDFDNIQISSINCDAGTNFTKLWQSIFRKFIFEEDVKISGFTRQDTVEVGPAHEFLPEKVSPDDVRHLFEQLKSQTVVIIDEVDRIGDKETTTRLADTIKTLSDHSVNTTLIMVGVADAVDELISEHQSVERALVQIQMPRMSRDELFEIIEKGLSKVLMSIDYDAKSQIAQLSQGLPHYTHLLSLHAAQHAASSYETNITLDDVKAATGQAVAQAQQSIVRSYHDATNSPRGNLYAQVLLACALAPTDDLGYFSSSAIRDPLTRIMGKRYEIPAFSRHLNDFCEDTRGPILQRTGYPRRYKFRFINPLMEPYIIMDGLSKGLIDEGALASSSHFVISNELAPPS